MVQKKYFKTKDYCKVKFILNVENAETVEILGLNSDWKNSIVMSRKKDGTFSCDVTIPKDTQHQFKCFEKSCGLVIFNFETWGKTINFWVFNEG